MTAAMADDHVSFALLRYVGLQSAYSSALFMCIVFVPGSAPAISKSRVAYDKTQVEQVLAPLAAIIEVTDKSQITVTAFEDAAGIVRASSQLTEQLGLELATTSEAARPPIVSLRTLVIVHKMQAIVRGNRARRLAEDLKREEEFKQLDELEDRHTEELKLQAWDNRVRAVSTERRKSMERKRRLSNVKLRLSSDETSAADADAAARAIAWRETNSKKGKPMPGMPVLASAGANAAKLAAARQEAARRKSGPPVAAMLLVSAAVKLQAAFRGSRGRRAVARLREQRTQFEPSRARPSPLLPGWVEAQDPRYNNATYWFHVQTRQTTWTRPTADRVEATLRLQFVARGMLVRRAVRRLRRQSVTIITPSLLEAAMDSARWKSIEGSLARRASAAYAGDPRSRPAPALRSRSSSAPKVSDAASTHPPSRRASAKRELTPEERRISNARAAQTLKALAQEELEGPDGDQIGPEQDSADDEPGGSARGRMSLADAARLPEQQRAAGAEPPAQTPPTVERHVSVRSRSAQRASMIPRLRRKSPNDISAMDRAPASADGAPRSRAQSIAAVGQAMRRSVSLRSRASSQSQDVFEPATKSLDRLSAWEKVPSGAEPAQRPSSSGSGRSGSLGGNLRRERSESSSKDPASLWASRVSSGSMSYDALFAAGVI